jgi:ribosomal protein S27E
MSSFFLNEPLPIRKSTAITIWEENSDKERETMEAIFLLLKNKRTVKLVILAILTLVLGVVVYIEYFSHTPPPEGAFRIVKCTGCGDQTVKQVKDINDPGCICGKCGKPLGYAFKCDVCDFEFPVIPVDKPPAGEMAKMKTMGKFNYVLKIRKCPNCGSTSTTPISVGKK